MSVVWFRCIELQIYPDVSVIRSETKIRLPSLSCLKDHNIIPHLLIQNLFCPYMHKWSWLLKDRQRKCEDCILTFRHQCSLLTVNILTVLANVHIFALGLPKQRDLAFQAVKITDQMPDLIEGPNYLLNDILTMLDLLSLVQISMEGPHPNSHCGCPEKSWWSLVTDLSWIYCHKKISKKVALCQCMTWSQCN